MRGSEKIAAFPQLRTNFPHQFYPVSAPRKTYMAYRKKYKALILKQVPCILKYMAYIFQLSKCLKNNVLKKGKNQPFPNDVWTILFRIAACIIQGFRHNRVAKQ